LKRVILSRRRVRAAFDWYAGVPCSYLTPFINYVLQDAALHYVSMANEGDAVALIAGCRARGAVGGGAPARHHDDAELRARQCGQPIDLADLDLPLPQLLIVTWRGQPGVADEPQHALMGPITPAMLDSMEIPGSCFRPKSMRSARRWIVPSRIWMRPAGPMRCSCKGQRRAYALEEPAPAPRGSRAGIGADEPRRSCARGAALKAGGPAAGRGAHADRLDRGVGVDRICGRELYAIDDRPNQLYMVGSMGCVCRFALGLALARPDLRVLALDGDGAALMRMGAFATVGAYGPPNLQHLLLDNGAHDSTGGQATVSARVSFARWPPPAAMPRARYR
jgi:phosphonopyruvate decarboxylase